ncbi:hypothetical protein GINT2_000298 [Glugoides intestinalis]
MAIYYTQILNSESKKILTGCFSLAGLPLKTDRTILIELKNAIANLPMQLKTFSLHTSKTSNLLYFKVTKKITLASIVDNRTTDKLISKYFEEVESVFASKYIDLDITHYDFDDKLKSLTDTFNKKYNVLLGVEELENTHVTLVESLDTLINRGESIKGLSDLAERVNFETKEMSRKVSQMKRNAKIEQYKIYMAIVVAVFLLLFLYFKM